MTCFNAIPGEDREAVVASAAPHDALGPVEKKVVDGGANSHSLAGGDLLYFGGAVRIQIRAVPLPEGVTKDEQLAIDDDETSDGIRAGFTTGSYDRVPCGAVIRRHEGVIAATNFLGRTHVETPIVSSQSCDFLIGQDCSPGAVTPAVQESVVIDRVTVNVAARVEISIVNGNRLIPDVVRTGSV